MNDIRMISVIKSSLSNDSKSEEGLAYEDYNILVDFFYYYWNILVDLLRVYFLISLNPAIRVFLTFPSCGPKLDVKMLPKQNWTPVKSETQN